MASRKGKTFRVSASKGLRPYSLGMHAQMLAARGRRGPESAGWYGIRPPPRRRGEWLFLLRRGWQQPIEPEVHSRRAVVVGPVHRQFDQGAGLGGLAAAE